MCTCIRAIWLIWVMRAPNKDNSVSHLTKYQMHLRPQSSLVAAVPHFSLTVDDVGNASCSFRTAALHAIAVGMQSSELEDLSLGVPECAEERVAQLALAATLALGRQVARHVAHHRRRPTDEHLGEAGGWDSGDSVDAVRVRVRVRHVLKHLGRRRAGVGRVRLVMRSSTLVRCSSCGGGRRSRSICSEMYPLPPCHPGGGRSST